MFHHVLYRWQPGSDRLPEGWILAETHDETLGDLVWLWNKWIPKGCVIIVAGMAGVGKSASLMSLCSSVVNLVPWPNGEAAPKKPGKIVWIETERREHLNKKRRKKFGLPSDQFILREDVKNFRLDSSYNLTSHRAVCNEVKPELIVIDSLGTGHRFNENSGKVGELIQDLDDIAMEFDISIIMTHHLRKQPTSRSSDRLSIHELRGSSKIGDRVQVVIGLDEPNPSHDKGHVRISHTKCNHDIEQPSLGARWKNGRLMFNFDPPQPPKEKTYEEKSIELATRLLAKGPKRSSVIARKMEEAGINFSTAKRAMKKFGMKNDKVGTRSYWYLPGQTLPPKK